MAEQAAFSRTENSVIFRFPTGTQLSDPERRHMREQLAASLLVNALCACPQFWAHVDLVAVADDSEAEAHRLSLAYCQGARREVLSRLLVRAVRYCEQRDAPSATFSGMAGVRTVGEASESYAVSFARDAIHLELDKIEQEHDGRHQAYALGAAFVTPMLRAASLVAARGAGTCLGWTSEGALCTSRAAGGLYCRRHDGAQDLSTWESERDTILRRLFGLARPAVLGQ
jgi:hypothetical protein